MPADKKWIFLAEHSDKTLMRNKIGFELGYLSKLDWTPQSVYAEVYINNDYRGAYNISQKVEESEHRVVLNDDGYLLEMDTPDHLKPDDIFFNSSKFLIQIKEPAVESDSPEYNYIKDYILEFETALFSSHFTDPDIGYRKYIDIDSFIDWYLINEIAKNQDAKDYSSIFLNLIPGEKLKMGPLWDFDLGFGNVNYSDCQYPEGFWVKDHVWIKRLFDDPQFVSKVKQRFIFYKINEDYLMDFIDNTVQSLKWAVEENDKKYGSLGEWVWPNPVVFSTHQEEVNYLKNWIRQRMNWLDLTYKNM